MSSPGVSTAIGLHGLAAPTMSPGLANGNAWHAGPHRRATNSVGLQRGAFVAESTSTGAITSSCASALRKMSKPPCS